MAIHDLVIRIGAQVSPGFQAGIKQAFSGIERLMGGAAGGALLGAPAGLLGLGNQRMGEMAQIKDLADSLGASTVYLSQLQRVAAVSGASFDMVAQQMARMTVTAAESPEKFARLGISVWKTNGELKNAEQLMKESMVALANETNTTQRAANAKSLFGRSYIELLPVIRNYNEEIANGSRVTEDAAKKADEYEKNLNRIWANIKERAAIITGGGLSAVAAAGAELTSLNGKTVGRSLNQESLSMITSLNRISNETEADPGIVELIRKQKDASRSQDVMVTRVMDACGGF